MKLWRFSLFLFASAAVLLQPTFTEHYYGWMLAHDAYPPHADSIGIPISANMSFWIVWAPVAATGFFFAFRKLQAPFRVFVWDESRKLKCWIVTLFCLTLVVLLVLEILDAIAWGNYIEIGYSLWWIIIWVLVRAALLTKKEPDQSPEPASRLRQ